MIFYLSLTIMTFYCRYVYLFPLCLLTLMTFNLLYFQFLQSRLGIQIGKVMAHSFTGGPGDGGLWTRKSVVAKSWQPRMTNMERICPSSNTCSLLPHNIYNSDETALFFKSAPNRTYCFEGDKPAGSAKCKDRLTLLINNKHRGVWPQKVGCHRQS